jgi:hypothetical protein
MQNIIVSDCPLDMIVLHQGITYTLKHNTDLHWNDRRHRQVSVEWCPWFSWSGFFLVLLWALPSPGLLYADCPGRPLRPVAA